MEYKTRESIKYIEFCTGERGENPTIVLFHGYGANAKDLAPLKDLIKSDKKFNWIFPEGIFDISLDSKCWFPVDTKAFYDLHTQKDYESLSLVNPPHLEESIFKIDNFLKSLGINNDKLILGGFSQGSNLALNLVFYREDKPKALILFSSGLMNKKKLSELSSSCKGLPFIQSHGENDDILSYEMGEKLYAFLQKSGLQGEFISFKGGHEIPPKILEKTKQFLKMVFP